jgi:DNA-3-methyladenine glycosylase
MYNTKEMSIPILPPLFYDRDVVLVARDLLGMRLVRKLEGQQISGYISETEAYDGQADLACHARVGKTARNSVLFGPPGRAYVYFTYGMHWCLNAVAGRDGYAAAVLIRAIIPQEGSELIAGRRAGVQPKHWTDGPAKITKALNIDKSQNGADLTSSESGLWIENGITILQASIQSGPRVGIERTPEPWRSMPWRFWYPADQILKKE